MTDLIQAIDRLTDGLCPCGAEPREGSAYCGDDCTPTHIAEDTTADRDGTPMRWRPDLVTAAPDDPDLVPIDSTGGYAGPFHPQVFQRRSNDVWHLRLDDGHRFVGSDLDAQGATGEELLAAMTASWRRLERELTNRRRTEPAGRDPWGDLVETWRRSQRYADRNAERERICAWLTANGISVNDVPESSEIRVRDGQLTVRVMRRDADGAVQLDEDRALLTDELTVPLTQPWEGPQPRHFDVDLHDDAQLGAVQRWGYHRPLQLTAEQQAAVLRDMTAAAARVRHAFEGMAVSVRPALENIGRAFQAARIAPAPLPDHPMLRVIEQRRRQQAHGPEQPRRAPRQLGPRRSR